MRIWNKVNLCGFALITQCCHYTKKQQQHFCSRINISNRSLRLATKYASNSKGLYAKAIIIVFVINVQNAPKRKIKMLNMLRQQMYD